MCAYEYDGWRRPAKMGRSNVWSASNRLRWPNPSARSNGEAKRGLTQASESSSETGLSPFCVSCAETVRFRGCRAHLAEYDYRFGSKLKSITTDIPDEEDVSYMYDGLGKLRFKDLDADGADKEWYRWDLGWNVVAQYADDNNAFWDIGTLGMSFTGKMALSVGSNPATATYVYMSHDHLGSVRRLRLDNKASLGSYEYTPYGNAYFANGNIPGFGYTGHIWQPEIGMYYAPYRMYTPATARWLTRDPLGMVDGPNVYAYVAGNPVGHADPSGAFFLPIAGGVVGCVVGALVGWLHSESTPVSGGRGAFCGCVGGFVSGLGSGLILGGLTSALGAFAQCMCEGQSSAKCCGKSAIAGGLSGAGVGFLFGALAGLGGSEEVVDLMESVGLAAGGTTGGSIAADCCED